MKNKRKRTLAPLKSVSRSIARKRRQMQNKKKMDKDHAAKVYEEFVASFAVDPPSTAKQLSIYYNKLINLNFYLSFVSRNFTVLAPRPLVNKQTSSKGRKKKTVKNIDLFVQEMKLNELTRKREKENLALNHKERVLKESDPVSSCVIIQNLSEVTELELYQELEKCGPIGTIKIRKNVSDLNANKEEALVNFMRREDALNFVKTFDGKKLFDKKVSVVLGPSLPLPHFPIEHNEHINNMKHFKSEEDENIKNNFTIEVKMMPEGFQKNLIDTVADFVSKEGKEFEENLAKLHCRDEQFKFMTNIESDQHKYYRWKVYSLSQGDLWNQWRKDPFRMVENGPLWIPPKVYEAQHDGFKSNKQKYGERKEFSVLIPNANNERKKPFRLLKDKKRDEFEDMLRAISKDKRSIRNVMGFCIDNSENAIEIVETITESLTIDATEIDKKIARLYLVSDILHNSDSNVRNSSAYRSEFQRSLKEIFGGLHKSYAKIDGRMTAEKMKDEILTVLHVWQAWSLFPVTFLDELEIMFVSGGIKAKEEQVLNWNQDEIDGVPLEDDIDGFELND